ncbi:hypothetical protein Dsin_003711 [Dipteronia sinensis]|uniref:Uncharacterized protein n=1 Tax=Dipteronia sinensis TaxID=43782 RepID=A0AAE0B9M3_9ROSI|nr:hypothetical protein Dsin_003711 [Dipteronia sinensis]
MDAEFCNRVYETLTGQGSSFTNINATLQKILTELQYLRIAHNENSFSHTTATYHSMFFDDTYISAEVFVDFDKPPIFDEYVFEKVPYESNSHFVDCFYESHVSHHKNSSVYLFLQDLMIQEFVTSHWSDWMDIMTKGEKFKVRRIRTWLLSSKNFMQASGMIHSAHHAKILVKWAGASIEDATWENHWCFSKTYPDFILEDKDSSNELEEERRYSTTTILERGMLLNVLLRNIVIACITLHNFLRKLSIDDELFLQYNDEDIQLDNDDANQNQTPSTKNEFRRADQVFMQQLRDQIADQFL